MLYRFNWQAWQSILRLTADTYVLTKQTIREDVHSLTTTASWERALRFLCPDGFLRGRASMESQVARGQGNIVTDVRGLD